MRTARSLSFGLPLLVLLAGCAGRQVAPGGGATAEPPLAEAAKALAAPGAPESLVVLDRAEAEFDSKGRLSLLLHRVHAYRAPPREAPEPLAVWNDAVQSFRIERARFHPWTPEKGFGAPRPLSVRRESVLKDPPAPFAGILTALFPEFSEPGAVEVLARLEPRTSPEGKEAMGGESSQVESAFAFRWAGREPALRRELSVFVPRNLTLRAYRRSLPGALQSSEVKTEEGEVHRFLLDGFHDALPREPASLPVEDLAPLSAFTVHGTWADALAPYARRVRAWREDNAGKMEDFFQEALRGLAKDAPLAERMARLKAALHDRVRLLETGLTPDRLPLRNAPEVLASRAGTAEELALLLAEGLTHLGLSPRVFRYRPVPLGELVADLPALLQLPGFLVGAEAGGTWTWLDPAEPLAPPGTLPLHALEVPALAVGDAVEWRRTPPFSAKDHRKERDIVMALTADGALECTVELHAFGATDVALRRFFAKVDPEQRRELVERGLSRRFPGATLRDYRPGDWRDLSRPLEVSYQFQVPRYASVAAGGNLTFHPLVFADVEDFLALLESNRKTPVLLPHNFNEESRVLVRLPKTHQVRRLPEDRSLSNSVAEFLSETRLELGTLTFTRYMGLKKQRIAPGSEYRELLDFYETVLKQDRIPFEAVKIR